MNGLPDRNEEALAKFKADTNARLAAGEIILVSGLGVYCILAAGTVIEHCAPGHMQVRSPSGTIHIYDRRTRCLTIPLAS